MRLQRFPWFRLLCIAASSTFVVNAAYASAPFVPGSGAKVSEVGDDFEDEEWEYVPNFPKSSYENDNRTRNPGGFSKNGRWFEPSKRGQPDYVEKRVETPAGGLPGSKGALLLRTLQSGIPGSPSYGSQQDDFVANVQRRVGSTIPISYEPSMVCRVFMPPVDEWENRSGSQFAFRAGIMADEEYWPGIFIQFQSETDHRSKQDGAYFIIRADQMGRDIKGPEITQTGWWTIGMSFTSDGRVHYFIKPGIENLTKEDFVVSYTPYGKPARQFETMFFDCFNRDDGRTWSTPFVVDDPTVYVMRGAEQLTAQHKRMTTPVKRR